MDFVKREDANVIDEASYKAYIENLQKTHQLETMEYQHTPISMEQLHQAMQSTLNPNNIIHNFQLPLSPRQMSTLMLKTNLSRNFAEIPAHLSRNLEMDLSQSLSNELQQNLRNDELVQNLNRNIDISLVASLRNELDLSQTLCHNMTEDLRLHDINVHQNLRADLPNNLNHEIDLSQHLNRQNLEQEMLEERRMIIQCVPDSHLIDQSNIPRLDQMRLEQNLRLDQNIGQRLEQNIQQSVVQRLDQIGQRLDGGMMQRLEHTQRLNVGQRENDVQLNQEHMPMQFHIKSEQEDDSYFYDNINQGMTNIESNDHVIPDNTNIQSQLQDPQMYSIYSQHATIPNLNPIDLYARNNLAQNYVARENPQNLIIHRQYSNPSPYTEDMKKLRQPEEAVPNDGKNKTEEPKENLKPSDQNKIYNEKSDDSSSKLSEELAMSIKGEYACFKCNEIFPSKRNLKQHAKVCVETDETEKVGKFCCSVCAYRCPSLAILKIHERTHTGDKPFACTFCDYKSGQKNNVAKHILVHMKEKPFRCQYCDYRCAQKNNLVVHERTHTGYKPFACPYCEYRTVQKPNLVKHMYLHTDQKPFSCDMCSYRCVQKTNLTKHRQRHLNEKDVGKNICKDQKPYRPRQKSVKCPHCPYRCIQKASMEKHVQFKHAGLEFNPEAFEQEASLMKDDDVQNLSVKKEDALSQVMAEPLGNQS